jgi:hypothetical protein
MDKKIVLILLTVVFIAAAATSPELELIVMADESQSNAEICLEEDLLDLKDTKADDDQVKNKYEAESTDTKVKTAESKAGKQTQNSSNVNSFLTASLPSQGLTLNIDTGFYYVNLPADMKAGWIKIGSTWNYFDTSGRDSSRGC